MKLITKIKKVFIILLIISISLSLQAQEDCEPMNCDDIQAAFKEEYAFWKVFIDMRVANGSAEVECFDDNNYLCWLTEIEDGLELYSSGNNIILTHSGFQELGGLMDVTKPVKYFGDYHTLGYIYLLNYTPEMVLYSSGIFPDNDQSTDHRLSTALIYGQSRGWISTVVDHNDADLEAQGVLNELGEYGCVVEFRYPCETYMMASTSPPSTVAVGYIPLDHITSVREYSSAGVHTHYNLNYRGDPGWDPTLGNENFNNTAASTTTTRTWFTPSAASWGIIWKYQHPGQ